MPSTYLFKEFSRYIGNSHRCNPLNLNNNMPVAFDSFDDTNNIFKTSSSDSNSLADFVDIIIIVKIENRVIVNRSHTHEVFHLFIGYSQDSTTFALTFHHISYWKESATLHLQFGYGGLRGMDKNQIVDSGNQRFLFDDIGSTQVITHGNKTFHPQIIKAFLDFHLPIVRNPHGEPSDIRRREHTH